MEPTFEWMCAQIWRPSIPLDQRLDYLVVDEAGQLSLSNVCAVATSARNVVVVGDSRQLSQPSQGTHSEGAGASALEHVLGGANTISPNFGVLLDDTHRLHPTICDYISEIYYQGRLQSLPGCELQTVSGPGWLSGSGLRWVPTDHRGAEGRQQKTRRPWRRPCGTCCRNLGSTGPAPNGPSDFRTSWWWLRLERARIGQRKGRASEIRRGRRETGGGEVGLKVR
ncbi:MAG: hypothetical protein M0Z47_03855, partial [Actinomycetota bacterium]|nr:hypothetical protein [Actinomycetota bacterium]